VIWEGAKVRNIVGLDEVSALGTPGESGVLVVDLPPRSDAATAGLLEGDIILACDGKTVGDVLDLLTYTEDVAQTQTLNLTILRYHQKSEIRMLPNPASRPAASRVP
jgi:S1-C subfamily serine protease